MKAIWHFELTWPGSTEPLKCAEICDVQCEFKVQMVSWLCFCILYQVQMGRIITRSKILKANEEETYHQVSNIRRTLVGNKIVDHSDVVGASPVGAAPTTSSFST